MTGSFHFQKSAKTGSFCSKGNPRYPVHNVLNKVQYCQALFEMRDSYTIVTIKYMVIGALRSWIVEDQLRLELEAAAVLNNVGLADRRIGPVLVEDEHLAIAGPCEFLEGPRHDYVAALIDISEDGGVSLYDAAVASELELCRGIEKFCVHERRTHRN